MEQSQVRHISGTDLLRGKVALITGGATGIGLGITRRFVRQGANVAIVSRDQANLDRAVLALNEDEGRRCAIGLRADVRNYEDVRTAIEVCVSEFGALDILVNNAAGNFVCPAEKLSPNGWRTVVDIDLNGTFHCCHASYNALKASGGCIISLVSALPSMPGMAPAAAAKAGIVALSHTLAVEWGQDNIRVNTIAPGPIDGTEGLRRLYDEPGALELQQELVPLGRLGQIRDIADVAAFLASPLANYITGADLVVDGGRRLTQLSTRRRVPRKCNDRAHMDAHSKRDGLA